MIDYIEVFHRLGARTNLMESEQRLIARFVGALRMDIKEKVKLQPFSWLSEASPFAETMEEMNERRSKKATRKESRERRLPWTRHMHYILLQTTHHQQKERIKRNLKKEVKRKKILIPRRRLEIHTTDLPWKVSLVQSEWSYVQWLSLVENSSFTRWRGRFLWGRSRNHRGRSLSPMKEIGYLAFFEGFFSLFDRMGFHLKTNW